MPTFFSWGNVQNEGMGIPPLPTLLATPVSMSVMNIAKETMQIPEITVTLIKKKKAYITNKSNLHIYFKPEETMTIDGKTYLDEGAYMLPPGQSWYHPVDGVKTSLGVFKIPGKYGFYGSVIINKQGDVDLFFYGFGDSYDGWLTTSPAPNWDNLFNSTPH